MNHEAHVVALKEELYSFISDASKDANGSRRRLDISAYSVAELESLADYYSDAAAEACEREHADYVRAIARFEEKLTGLIEVGAGDRETAVRWMREAYEASDPYMAMYGDESMCYAHSLPYTFDLDAGKDKYYPEKWAA